MKAVFGGGQILVPPSWRVITHTTGIGGMQDSRPAMGQVEGAPTLTIEGVVVFGGFQVLSELDEDQEEWLRSQEAAADTLAASKAKALDVPDELSPATGAEPEMTPAG